MKNNDNKRSPDNTGLQAFNKADNALNQILEKVNSNDESQKIAGKLLKVKTANEWNWESVTRPDPKSLWRSLWYEGEICCLFADSNLGKSILAVQILCEIAKDMKVIYFDFELSGKQFQLRCTDNNGRMYQFPQNFLRAEIDPNAIDFGNFEDAIIDEIENAVQEFGAKVVVIDNITYLCSAAEKGDVAGRLMIRLRQLSQKHKLSMLVVAHTPKRPLSSPITQNDLAGSKKLFNFFGSAVAIGQSAKDSGQRYIKQIKTRQGAIEYGADNVIVCEIVKDDCLTKFKVVGQATEQEHLSTKSDKDKEVIFENVKAEYDKGKSVREIADFLGISRSSVGRIIKKIKRIKIDAKL